MSKIFIQQVNSFCHVFTLPEHLFLHETSGIIIFASISFNGLEEHHFVTRQGRSIKHKNKLKRKYYQLFLDIAYSIYSLLQIDFFVSQHVILKPTNPPVRPSLPTKTWRRSSLAVGLI